MMPLPWLKKVSVSYRCWRYWPFIFFGIGPIPNLAVSHTAILPLYIVRAHTVHTLMERTKLQSRTNRELVGIRGLVSLNSEHSNRPSVICQITGWWMVPPLMYSGGEAFDVRLSLRLIVLCNMTRSLFSSRPPPPKRQTCSTSARTTEECHGGRDDTQRPVWVPVSNERPSFKASFSCVSQHRRRQDAGERHHAAKWVWDVWF